ncbi:hypothetical protein [Microvirga sp. Mcv34]|uniref:hypothetical protein n=1 Tax=Microvirga sp. Mcv34 TaxID=2926016 RepID=UPI0021C5907D|nr:hypothetical protein [Microvirga sp. Mcv34]
MAHNFEELLKSLRAEEKRLSLFEGNAQVDADVRARVRVDLLLIRSNAAILEAMGAGKPKDEKGKKSGSAEGAGK